MLYEICELPKAKKNYKYSRGNIGFKMISVVRNKKHKTRCNFTEAHINYYS